jgi:cation/acetate symporter
MLTGTFLNNILIYLSPTIQVDVLKHDAGWFPLKNPALVTIPLSFLVGFVVSLMTATADADARHAHHEREMHLGT